MRASVAKHHPSELTIDEKLFERILRLVPDVVYVYDLATGRNVFANRQIEEVLGYPIGTIRQLGENVLEALVHPEDWSSVQAHVGRMRLARDQEVLACEYRMRHADHSWRVLVSRDQALRRDDEGRVQQILGCATDLTALKQKDRLLRTSVEQLSILFQAIAECYIGLDGAGRVIELNAHAAEWIGRTSEQLIGRRIEEVLADNRELVDAVEQACISREPQHKSLLARRHPGRSFELSAYPAESGTSVVIRDVTDRERVGRSIAEAASLLQATIDALTAEIVIIDEDGAIISANRSWIEGALDHVGSERIWIGTNYFKVFPFDVPCGPGRVGVKEHLIAVIAGEKDSFRASYKRFVRGEERWFQVRAQRFLHFDRVRVVLANEDITELKQRERERRDVARRLLQVQDEERRRIGRELHDSTGQTIAGIQLGLARLRTKLEGDHDAQEILADMKEALTRAQSDLRVFSLLLHPPLLEDSNVASVLRQFTKSFAARTGLVVDFSHRGSLPNLRPEVGLTLLRITQEALANVHRHARAERVRVALAKRRGALVLEVEDDGVGVTGLDRSGTQARFGVGLAGMKARARELHGELTIERRKAGGTLVRATLPFEEVLKPTD